MSLVAAALALLAQERPDYERDIRPILERSCVSCHGPEKSKGRVRLDTKASALRTGRKLYDLLVEPDEELRMPRTGPRLPAREIEFVRSWIDHEIPAHWAYVKPRRPEPPPVDTSGWIRNPIDAFVLARLEKEGLAPSPEAPREKLLRRASLDLIGLPPTVAEMDAAESYEQAVDRLLASPHFGERWARPWLDLARYADSNGYEKDSPRTVWKWRDWVIDALNRDLPFDRFTVEQVAGDLLPDATLAQRIATGFHRNSMLNEEDGVDREEARWNTLVERAGTVGTVWLGTTLACAQCHNHKFDPFSQADFYRLLAFFETADEPVLEDPTPAQAEKRRVLQAELARVEAAMDHPSDEVEAELKLWEAEQRRILQAWTPLLAVAARSSEGATLLPREDRSVLAVGPTPEKDIYTIVAKGDPRGITAVAIEVLPDPSLPRSGPGRAPSGDFLLTEFKVRGAALRKAAADFASKFAWIHQALDGDPETGWAVGPQVGQRHWAHFETAAPVTAAELTFVLEQQSRHPRHTLGRFRLWGLVAENPSEALQLPERIRTLLEKPSQPEIRSYYLRAVAPGLKALRTRAAELRKEIEALGIPTAWVLRERPGAGRPSTFLRHRGNFLVTRDRIEADVPSSLPRLPEGTVANRLGLARWLVSPENPLTARVAVNRLWEQVFGRGLVETSEDFGTQGARPSHPELLDWLATEYVRLGWSTKAMLRTIVTSAAYRQSSRVASDRDPQNRLLSRGASYRMEAEMIRDVALAASGLLSRKIGGPSVHPVQPEGIWSIAASNDRWVTSDGEDRRRRGLYTFWRRSAPYPSFTTFDAPSRETCAVRRTRTTTPLQALTLLNDPAFFEAARALGSRMEKEGLEYGFRACTGRRPDEGEREILERLLRTHGDWTLVANTLLNLDETTVRD